MARRANSTATLLAQVNAKYPNRSKASDGWIGDAAHASRPSDHNPLPNGVVLAQDITHDPAHGLDIQKLFDSLIASKDNRINYLIFNRRIWQGSWKPYSGSNPHDKHGHISVKNIPSLYDDGRQWNLSYNAGGQEEMLTKESIQVIYNLAFKQDAYPVPADVFTAYIGKPHSALLTQLQNDPTYQAFKKRVNSLIANPGTLLKPGRYEVQ